MLPALKNNDKIFSSTIGKGNNNLINKLIVTESIVLAVLHNGLAHLHVAVISEEIPQPVEDPGHVSQHGCHMCVAMPATCNHVCAQCLFCQLCKRQTINPGVPGAIGTLSKRPVPYTVLQTGVHAIALDSGLGFSISEFIFDKRETDVRWMSRTTTCSSI